MFDLIIIGSGPSGLAASLAAKQKGIDYLVLEQGVIAQTIFEYPLLKPLFSTADEVELAPGYFPRGMKPTREQVLSHYSAVATTESLKILTGVEVTAIQKTGDSFKVVTRGREFEARTVLLATGGFGNRRSLGVPGEIGTRVSYRFVEASPYFGKAVLVVGAGNSAAEAALFLEEAGAFVTLSTRSVSLSEKVTLSVDGNSKLKIKPWVREPLERAIEEGRIRLVISSEVVEILPHSAVLRSPVGSNETRVIACDHVFALIGADPDTTLLEDCGAEVAQDGRPIYDSSYETTVKGLFVTGHLTRDLHMKNAISGAPKVVDQIERRLQAPECNATGTGRTGRWR